MSRSFSSLFSFSTFLEQSAPEHEQRHCRLTADVKCHGWSKWRTRPPKQPRLPQNTRQELVADSCPHSSRVFCDRSRSLRRWAKSTAWRGSRLPSRCVFVPPCTRCISTFGKTQKHTRMTRLAIYGHERDEICTGLDASSCAHSRCSPPPTAYSSSCPRVRTFSPAPDPTPTPYHSSAIAPLVSINCRSHSPSLVFQSRVHCSSGREALRRAPEPSENLAAHPSDKTGVQ